jgi:hypothetical protein
MDEGWSGDAMMVRVSSDEVKRREQDWGLGGISGTFGLGEILRE